MSQRIEFLIFPLLILSIFLSIFSLTQNKILFQKAQISEPFLNQKEEKVNQIFEGITSQLNDFQNSFLKLEETLEKINKNILAQERSKVIEDQIFEIKSKILELEAKNKEFQNQLEILKKEIQGKTTTTTLNEKEAQTQEKEPISPKRLLIVEVCAGMDSASNEFIEIYNPEDFPVKIDDQNFVLELVNSKNEPTKKKIEWRRNIIPSKGYFLFAGGELESQTQRIEADAYFSSQLTSISGVIIKDKEGNIFDKVGWGKEGEPFPTLAVESKPKLKSQGLQTGESLQRKFQFSQYIDTDNNQEDFEFSLIITPQNSLGERIVYSKGESSQETSQTDQEITETSQIASQENTKNQTQSEKILITKVQFSGDEFVELFNPTDQPIYLKDKYLAYYSSSREINDPYRIWQIQGSIPPKSHFLIGIYLQQNSTIKPDFQILTKEGQPYSKPCLSSNGTMGIFSCNPKERGNECKLDLVGWGETKLFEGAPVQISTKDIQVQRKKQDSFYQDTDNNFSDFIPQKLEEG